MWACDSIKVHRVNWLNMRWKKQKKLLTTQKTRDIIYELPRKKATMYFDK